MKRVAWRPVLLTVCAFAVLVQIPDTLDVTGMGGAPPWQGSLGANTGASSTPFNLTVASVDAGGPAARAGLRRGDLIDIRANTLGERFSFFGAPLNGRPLILSTHRGSLQKELTVIPRPQRLAWDFWPGTFATLWLLLLAALIAWRRADSPQMRLLSLWLSLFTVAGGTFAFVTPWAWVDFLVGISNTMVAWLSVGVFVAFASCFALPLSRARRVIQWLSYALVGIAIAVAEIAVIGAITLWFDPLPFYSGQAVNVIVAAAVLLAVICSVLAIAASRGVERQRAVWTLVPIAVFFCVFIGTGIATSSSSSYAFNIVLTLINNLAFITASVALMYAALSRRLIDTGFFLNRAAVFTIVSTIVIGAFVLAEYVASEWFVSSSHTASTVIGMGLALALGLSMRFIHRHVDRFVDRVFFRKRNEDEAALRRFAHESSYITDRSILLERAVREVKEHTAAAEATVFVQDGAATYIQAEADGAGTSASENDPGILALRAWHKPVDLGALENSVLHGELAFPMVSRGRLVGILVCGAKRNGEAYAPDESEALLTLAHGVGTSLDVLSAQLDRPNELVLRELAGLREAVNRMSRT